MIKSYQTEIVTYSNISIFSFRQSITTYNEIHMKWKAFVGVL